LEWDVQVSRKSDVAILASTSPSGAVIKDCVRVRVLFVPEWYPRDGLKQVSGTFCREHVLAAAVFDDVAVLAYTAREEKWPTLNWKRVNDSGIPTFYATHGCSPIPHTTQPFFYMHFWRALRRAIREWGRPDVIHTQDRYAYTVIKATEGLNIPCVISQHWGGFMRRELDDKAVRRFRWAFARASRVLPANKFYPSDYDHYGFKANTAWLPNTIDTKVFCASPQTARKPWLLHASGFTPEKRFPDIIAAFSRVSRLRPGSVLHVAGDGPNRAAMEALATRELPPESFVFHGFISKPELAALMRQASGFVFPSQAETFGCVLMEAMACGCPVMTTRVGGIPGVVHEGEGLFVEVGNIDQISEDMILLLDHTHGLHIERISKEVHTRFSHEAVGRVLHQEHLKAAGVTTPAG
jgi:glycosyltransferase involved in cell wall biosynthesis